MQQKFVDEKGFTLIETMVVIAIIGILIGAFGTSMVRWLPDYRFNNYVLELQGAIQNARLAAVRNNADVIVALSLSNSQFSVFIDSNNSGSLDAGEVSLGTFPAPRGVAFTDLFAASSDNQVAFNNRGFADKSGNICLKSSNDKYKGVSLTLAGCSTIIRSADGNTWN